MAKLLVGTTFCKSAEINHNACLLLSDFLYKSKDAIENHGTDIVHKKHEHFAENLELSIDMVTQGINTLIEKGFIILVEKGVKGENGSKYKVNYKELKKYDGLKIKQKGGYEWTDDRFTYDTEVAKVMGGTKGKLLRTMIYCEVRNRSIAYAKSFENSENIRGVEISAYDLAKRISTEEISGEKLKDQTKTISNILKRFEKNGLVTSFEQGNSKAKRYLIDDSQMLSMSEEGIELAPQEVVVKQPQLEVIENKEKSPKSADKEELVGTQNRISKVTPLYAEKSKVVPTLDRKLVEILNELKQQGYTDTQIANLLDVRKVE